MRHAQISRITSETNIELKLEIEGKGEFSLQTGIGFFDHMLNTLARFSLFNLSGNLSGDLHVDQHHTVEDLGIVFGECLKKALGDKRGINRNGFCIYPMDESLVMISLDICNRGYLVFDFDFHQEKTGSFENRLIKDFFQSFCSSGGITLHMKKFYGYSDHHSIEAAFKGLGKSLYQACSNNPDLQVMIPSTKGLL